MKLSRLVAFILAVAILCIGMTTTSYALYYEEQVKKFEAMQTKTVQINIENDGLYSRKTQKFWARKILGVEITGDYVLGPWECFNDCPDHFTLPATYNVFGYSVDITWGTDWPYSGCFRNEKDLYDLYHYDIVDQVSIKLDGAARCVGVQIRVNNRRVVNLENCDSHSEWRPI